MLVVMEDHGRYRVARPDRRRRRRRGVRQGRALPRPRLPGRPGDRPARGEGDPAAVRVPAADARRRLDFSFSGLKTAVVNHVRTHARRARSPTSPRRSRRRSSTSSSTSCSPRPTRPARRRSCIGGGVAANSRLRARVADGRRARPGGRAFLPPPCALHRQRGDDRGRRLVAARGRRPHPARRRRRPQPPPLNLAPSRSAGCSGGAGWYWSLSTRTRASANDRFAGTFPRPSHACPNAARRHTT